MKRKHPPRYIIDSFNAFISNKYHIILDLGLMNKYLPILCKLIMDENNMLKLDVLAVFEYLKHIEIIAKDAENAVDLVSLSAELVELGVFTRNNVTLEVKAVHSDITDI